METFLTGRRPACSATPVNVRVTGSLAVEPQLPLQWGLQINTHENGAPLAKPNYQYQKRQKELEKKKKQEEKRKRKLEAKGEGEPGAEAGGAAAAPVAGEEAPPV